ncbi:VOC family protein [Streptomyces sp. NBC_00063]|uniref:VOC family protein n=1 Tax=Streptomyces sp. NBC_00063 TaxID=2975638 RepID=UPI003D7544DA
MSMHRLNSVTIGVPEVDSARAYYQDFGLTPEADGWFATQDGGRQLKITHAPTRRLVALSIGADDSDDLHRIAAQLSKHGFDAKLEGDRLVSAEPVTGIGVEVVVTARVVPQAVPQTPYNGPGRDERGADRAPVITRVGPVRPRKLGHVVVGSIDQEASQRYFAKGIGLKVSDDITGLATFMRCSTDHHNVLVQSSPVNFLHHTSWEVDDLDEVGRGAVRMLEGNPERHVWGLGRHLVGSNFFWYLRDPAGNFTEYYSDLDCIVDDALWKPRVWDAASSMTLWGPPLPPSFLQPEDLAGMMAGAHQP